MSLSRPGEMKSPVKLQKSPGPDAMEKKLDEANKALKQHQMEFMSYKKDKMENDKYECCYDFNIFQFLCLNYFKKSGCVLFINAHYMIFC
jgi:hypothetical protein